MAPLVVPRRRLRPRLLPATAAAAAAAAAAATAAQCGGAFDAVAVAGAARGAAVPLHGARPWSVATEDCVAAQRVARSSALAVGAGVAAVAAAAGAARACVGRMGKAARRSYLSKSILPNLPKTSMKAGPTATLVPLGDIRDSFGRLLFSATDKPNGLCTTVAEGIEVVWSEEHGQYYYFNPATEVSCWSSLDPNLGPEGSMAPAPADAETREKELRIFNHALKYCSEAVSLTANKALSTSRGALGVAKDVFQTVANKMKE